jgi:hypothetical protein
LTEQDQGKSPLYFWALSIWCSVAGLSELALRLPSAVAGTLLIPVVYLWSRQCCTRTSSLVAASMTALSPPLILLSREARGYTLAHLCALSGAWLAMRALRRKHLDLATLFGVPLTSFFALLFHPFCALLPFASFVVTVYRIRPPLGRLLLVASFGASLLAIYIPFALTQSLAYASQSGPAAPQTPTPRDLAHVGVQLAGGRLALVMFAVVVTFSFLTTARPRLRHVASSPHALTSYALLLLVASAALLSHDVRLSFSWAPTRYFSFAVPLCAILLGNLVTALCAYLRSVTVLLLIASLCYGEYQECRLADSNVEDWRSTATLLTCALRPAEQIVCDAGYTSPCLLWYAPSLDRRVVRLPTSTNGAEEVRRARAIIATLHRGEAIWLVQSHSRAEVAVLYEFNTRLKPVTSRHCGSIRVSLFTCTH